MNVSFLMRFTLLVLLCAAYPLQGFSTGMPAVSPVPATLKPRLESFLHHAVYGSYRPTAFYKTRYSAYEITSSSGQKEVAVYLMGNFTCGSGGCTLLILQNIDGSFSVLGRTTICLTPIYVLSKSSHGRPNYAVHVRGDAGTRGYEAELQFDGREYPPNPSASSVRSVDRINHGRLLFSGNEPAFSL